MKKKLSMVKQKFVAIYLKILASKKILDCSHHKSRREGPRSKTWKLQKFYNLWHAKGVLLTIILTYINQSIRLNSIQRMTFGIVKF